MANKVKVDTRKLDQILGSVDGAVAEVIGEWADDVVADAKALAPVDKGDLRQSIYKRTLSENDVPAVGAGIARVELPEPKTLLSVTIGPSVVHGIHQELGTSKLSAQPYLAPAFKKNAAKLPVAKLGKAISHGK